MTQKVQVEGMSCGHCAMSVREALASLEGVSSVDVDLEGGTAHVESNRNIPQDAFARAIESAGYTFVSVS